MGVTLNVLTAPQLTAGPGLSFNVPTGTSSQQITIANANTGGAALNWTAALDPAAPSFITLSAGSGTNLLGGTSTTTSVNINATGLPGGSSYSTRVTITAFDPITGKVVVGSPSTIAVTITIAPPQMALSASNLAFTTTAGSNPAAQTISIQNTGGDTLSWKVGAPSAVWLTVTPASGSDNAQVSSTRRGWGGRLTGRGRLTGCGTTNRAGASPAPTILRLVPAVFVRQFPYKARS